MIFSSDWEARMDSHGRIFYIDHLHHTTTWQKPSVASGSGPDGSEEAGEQPTQRRRQQHVDRQRQQLDQRYQRVHRTIKATNSSVSSEADLEGSGVPYAEGTSSVSADRQRELLLQVSAKFYHCQVLSIIVYIITLRALR
jgi:hypothetical protein